MIVACSSCPAQYSVPDAKIRGKKVRVTCKHCGAAIIVDATGEPQREELRLEALEALAPPTVDVGDDATSMMPKRSELSVHEEPTVIGHVPAAALEAERRYSLSTAPPPPDRAVTESPRPPRALPHDVPEGALDVTNIASPQAKRASQASLPPEPLPPVPRPVSSLPPPAARSVRPSLGAPPPVELKTMLSRTEATPARDSAARTLYWLVAGLVVLLLALAFMRTMR